MRKIVIKPDKNHPAIKAYSKAVERGMKAQHVVPKDNGWAVKRARAKKSTKVFNTQGEASKYAKEIAKNNGGSLFIHRKDGRIRDRVDY